MMGEKIRKTRGKIKNVEESWGEQGADSVFNGLAVCFSTDCGDGSYPVYAAREDGRILKVEIDMGGEGQDEDFGEEEEV